jgi:hypothetical protein
MKTNEKHEVITQFARRSLVPLGLFVAALCFARPSQAQSNAAPTSSPGAKPADAAVSQTQAPHAAPQSPRPALLAKPADPSEKNPSSPAKGQHEGIKVHGHWTIDVRNPDGSLARHVEFENGLQFSGVDLLPALLGRTASPGAWAIVLSSSFGSNVPGPCTGSTFIEINGATGVISYGTQSCLVVETNGYYADIGSPVQGCSLFTGATGTNQFGAPFSCFTGLQVQVVQAGTVAGPSYLPPWPVYGLQLSGTFIVPAGAPPGAAISNAATFLAVCTGGLTGLPTSAVDPQTCATTSSPSQPENIAKISAITVGNVGQDVITATNLPAPVPVISGQSVSATVMITFQ